MASASQAATSGFIVSSTVPLKSSLVCLSVAHTVAHNQTNQNLRVARLESPDCFKQLPRCGISCALFQRVQGQGWQAPVTTHGSSALFLMLALSGVSPLEEKGFKQNQTLTMRKSDPFFFTPVSPQATSLPCAWNLSLLQQSTSSDVLLMLLYPTILQFAPPQPAAVSLNDPKDSMTCCPRPNICYFLSWELGFFWFVCFCPSSWVKFNESKDHVCFNNCQLWGYL